MGYDGLDRLTAANAANLWGTGTYSYDALGNMRTSVVGARSSSHNYDAKNLLSSITTNGSSTNYAYDAQGNVVTRGAQGFYFDQGNRLQSAAGLASYVYDGLGRRVNVTTTDGQNRTQIYSQDGQLLYGVYQDKWQTQTERYVYLGGKAIAQTNSSTGTTYLHTDALGSVVASVGNAPAQVTYSCPSGWTLSGTTCTQSSSSTVAATVTGYSCPLGYALSGSTCSKTTTTTSPATATYSCPSGWTLSGTSCTTNNYSPATPVYSCPSGWTLSGSTCSGTITTAANFSWDCKGHGSLTPRTSSPSGYYCTIVTISAAPDESPGPDCADKAALWGLAYVGSTPNGTTKANCYIGPVALYSCPAGATLSGTSCTSPATQPATVGYYTCSAGTVSGSQCVTTSTAAAGVSYSCPSGQTLSGSSCVASSTASTPGTPIYSCPTGYTLSGSSCNKQGTATMAATAAYSCPSGGSLSGSTCVGVLSRTRYEAYGKTAAGVVPNKLGFTGHVNDADTGLVYMQQRYYDPVAGRFLSVDPVTTYASADHGFNRYEYTHNNPYTLIDPDGADPIQPNILISYGLSATLFNGNGLNIIGSKGQELHGFSIGLTLTYSMSDPQIALSVSGNELNGKGLFMGGGIVVGGGVNNGPISSGSSKYDAVEFGVGLGKLSAGAQITSSEGGPGGTKGTRYGEGIGAYVAEGSGNQTTIATPAASQIMNSMSNAFQGVFQVSGRLDSKKLEKQLKQKKETGKGCTPSC